MADEYPEFQLRLPHGGPLAHGRLLAERGTNGSQKFMLLAGCPARTESVPSFAVRHPSSYGLRQQLINDGSLVQSAKWPGWLEATRDITCNSPSSAAEVVMGHATNGFRSWKTTDGHPLGDFIAQEAWGPRRTWLVRGSNVTGADLVKAMWLPEGRVTLAATRLRREGVEQGMSKDALRGFVEEDYSSTSSYNQRMRLVEDLHAFLSRMKPGDGVCTLSGGRLYVGEITGEAVRADSGDGRSNLRRPVE